MGSSGAIDNASGVTALLLLAELLAGYEGKLGLELVALNGEDYFSNPGEQLYLVANAGRFDEIILGINLDGVGYHRGDVAYSLYDCPDDMTTLIRDIFIRHEGFVEGEPWYAGDHGLFLMNKRPALALTSANLAEVMAIVHTAQDTPENIETTKLVDVAVVLHHLLMKLDDQKKFMPTTGGTGRPPG